jgi:hypothetical protein
MKTKTTGLILFAMFLFAFYSCKEQGNVFNVKDYGASGNKADVVTNNIQKAIDACTEAGGGLVYFPPGDYTTGTIILKDNVTLHVEAGATIWTSQNVDDMNYDLTYKEEDAGRANVPGQTGTTPVLIYAKGVKHIGIIGKGVIHGDAVRDYEELKSVDGFIEDITENAREAGVEMKRYYKRNPYTVMIYFKDCEFITIRDISLKESMDWMMHLMWSRKIFIDNVYMESSLEAGVNSDGIDLDGCQDVVISNCIITTGDDAIVLKTTINNGESRPCENITVTNCVLTSTSTGMKLGTESHNDFRNINFNNSVIHNTNRGLSIVIRDGGTAENIVFSDITLETNRKHFNWWGNGDPIWLVLLKRNPDSKLGMIRNVTFRNIIAHGQGTSKIEGFEGKPLENIKLKDVQLFMNKEEYPDKRADDAFMAHKVNNLTLENVEVYWNEEEIEPKWNNAFTFENINDLRLMALRGKQAPTNNGVFIEMNNVQDAIVERCAPFRGTNTFLRVKGPKSAGIILNDNYLHTVSQRYDLTPEVIRTVLTVK